MTVADLYIGARVGVSLATGETPVEFVGLDDGGLLFTTIDGELHARTITSTLSMPGGVVIEESWGGELAVHERDDGLVQLAWTRRTLSLEGYVLTDIAMTSISAAGKTTPKHYHMPALKLSEGSYYGFTFDQYDGTMVLAGYHRDLSTGGSWQDLTSIFVLSSPTPDRGPSWGNAVTVLVDIDIQPADAQPLAVGLGEEYLHIFYQEYRDDVTGLERVGLMYTHGPLNEPSWSFQYSIGDDATSPQLNVLVDDGSDRLVGAWIEGQGKTATVASISTDSIWSNDNVFHTSTPGVTSIALSHQEDGVYLYHDEINVYGPISRMGLIADENGEATPGLSNMLFEGYTFGIGAMGDDTVVCTVTPAGVYSLTKVVSLGSSQDEIKSPGPLETLLEYLPGESEEFKIRLLGIIALVFVSFLAFVIVSVRRSHAELEGLEAVLTEEKDTVEIMVNVELDEGPLLLIDESEDELVVSESTVAVIVEEEETLAEELEKKLVDGEGNARLERRMQRKQQREMGEMAAALQQGLPPLPLPGQLPPLQGIPLPVTPIQPAVLPLPDLKRDVQCPECQASFSVKDLMLKRTNCPVCGSAFDL